MFLDIGHDSSSRASLRGVCQVARPSSQLSFAQHVAVHARAAYPGSRRSTCRHLRVALCLTLSFVSVWLVMTAQSICATILETTRGLGLRWRAGPDAVAVSWVLARAHEKHMITMLLTIDVVSYRLAGSWRIWYQTPCIFWTSSSVTGAVCTHS